MSSRPAARCVRVCARACACDWMSTRSNSRDRCVSGVGQSEVLLQNLILPQNCVNDNKTVTGCTVSDPVSAAGLLSE